MPLSFPPAGQFIESLRSRIVEGRTLTPSEFRPVLIPLQVTLSSSRLTGTAQYVLPSNQRMIVRQFLPHVVPTNVSAAANALTSQSLTGGSVTDVLVARATNCRIDLAMASRTFNFIARQSFALSDLMASNGFPSTLADMPGILPPGTTIDLSAALVDDETVTGTNQPDCEYGLVIVGALVQV